MAKRKRSRKPCRSVTVHLTCRRTKGGKMRCKCQEKRYRVLRTKGKSSSARKSRERVMTRPPMETILPSSWR